MSGCVWLSVIVKVHVSCWFVTALVGVSVGPVVIVGGVFDVCMVVEFESSLLFKSDAIAFALQCIVVSPQLPSVHWYVLSVVQSCSVVPVLLYL